METRSIKKVCFFCGQEFSFGPHRYDGKPIKKYNLISCNICLSTNSDGVGPAYEEKLIKHLETEGLTIPDRNGKGLFSLEGG